MDKENMVVKFFHHLWKRNKDLESCTGVRIPDTVTYEHNFPTGYYYFQSNSINKKVGKDLESMSLYNDFIASEDPSHGIIAFYLSQHEDANTGEISNRVEFLDKEGLNDFFFKRKVRERGILQKFLSPKGSFNVVIQAIWSPHVLMLERRVNQSELSNSKLSPFERAVTYEGPSHFSHEVFCSPHLKEQIEVMCRSIVNHFEETEHKKITRMVLYLKIDASGDLWLMYCSSIRIGNGDDDGKHAPLDISPRFRTQMQKSDDIFDTLDPDGSNKRKSSPQRSRSPEGRESRLSNANNSFADASLIADNKAVSEEEKMNEFLESDQQALQLADLIEETLYQCYSFFLSPSNDVAYSFQLPQLVQQCFQDCTAQLNYYLHKYEFTSSEPRSLSGTYSLGKRSGHAVGTMQHQHSELRKKIMRLYYKMQRQKAKAAAAAAQNTTQSEEQEAGAATAAADTTQAADMSIAAAEEDFEALDPAQ